MAKRQYASPILLLQGGGDDTISFGNSQQTSGYDSIFTWDAELDDQIGMYDDTDLEAMDTNHNYHITVAEFDAYTD